MHTFFYYSITACKTYENAVISCDLDKLELFGADYIFMCAEKYEIDMSFKTYVTDSLKIIAENTARFAGGNTIGIRFFDIINPKSDKTNRSPEEVKESILSEFRRLGGEK